MLLHIDGSKHQWLNDHRWQDLETHRYGRKPTIRLRSRGAGTLHAALPLLAALASCARLKSVAKAPRRLKPALQGGTGFHHYRWAAGPS